MQKVILIVLCAFGAIAGTFFVSLFATDFFYYIREKILQKTFQKAIKSDAYFFYNNKKVMDMKVELINRLHHASIFNYKHETAEFLDRFEELRKDDNQRL